MFYSPELGTYLVVLGTAIKPGSLEPGRNGLGERTGNEVRERNKKSLELSNQ